MSISRIIALLLLPLGLFGCLDTTLSGALAVDPVPGEGSDMGVLRSEPPTPGYEDAGIATPPDLGASSCRAPPARAWSLSPHQLGWVLADLIPGIDPNDVTSRLSRFALSGNPYTSDPQVLNGSRAFMSELSNVVREAVRETPTRNLLDCADAEPLTSCARAFLAGPATRWLRGPLSPEFVAAATTNFDDDVEAWGEASATEALIRRLLHHPQVLFRGEYGQPEEPPAHRLDAYELASQIAFTLTDRPPDDELWALAVSGELQDPAVHRAQVERLLSTPPDAESLILPTNDAQRNVTGLMRFFREWMGVDGIRLSPAGGNGNLAQRQQRWLDNEAMMFVRHALWEGPGTLSYLLTADRSTYSNTLADFYGFDRDESADASTLRPNTQDRVGVLMHAGFLISHPTTTARGLFIRERLLCQPLSAPLEADMNLAGLEEDLEEELGRELSPREVRERHLNDPNCSGCHLLIDPLGFPLDGFDDFGTAREQWDGFPIDLGGDIRGSGDTDGPVTGPQELMQRLAHSRAVESCFVRQLFQFVHGRPPAPSDQCYVDRLQSHFSSAGGDIRNLLVEMMTGEEMRQRTRVQP